MTFHLWDEALSASIPIEDVRPNPDGSITVTVDTHVFDPGVDQLIAEHARTVTRSVIAYIVDEEGGAVRVARSGQPRVEPKNILDSTVRLRYSQAPDV